MPEASGDAPVGAAPVALSGPERSLLLALRGHAGSAIEEEVLGHEVGLPADQVRGSLQRLRSKHLVQVEEEHETIPRLTPKGEAALERGLPERRFLEAMAAHGGLLTPDDVSRAGLDDEERSAAIGILRRRALLSDGLPFRLRPGATVVEGPLPEETVLREVAKGSTEVDDAIFETLTRRGLVREDHRSIKRWSVSEEGRRLPLAAEGEELLGSVTTGLLTSGGWRGRTFRPYDVRAPVPYVTGARPNPYLAWLEEFEDILVGLGFEQAEGPLLETEFWNNDVLFMPQDHPARSIHDALSVEGVEGRPPPAELLARVAAAHEGRALPGMTSPLGPGWSTPYDVRVAVRSVLRSQTTAVSARYLARRPRPPFRMFSIDRNFRREEVDARHHLEFGQCEGVIGEDGLDLRHLVGVFTTLAEAIGLREMKIRPSYFPFTEPSIEGYVRHPQLGWIEVFPGGLLRPEVLAPLGVEVPVLAWGIGVTRLAMVALGCNDIRELFEDDLAALTGGSP
ncbi:MAG TPA: phenylalanine--tRNA ligase subunit alpha [Thermoplasmata archaeon]|nr:phenylalanine--tRNA ligase subunit alpha [Thermoplasmata archaeon]